MAECPCCGRWSEPDPQTGYDVDEVCPECKLDDPDCASQVESDDFDYGEQRTGEEVV